MIEQDNLYHIGCEFLERAATLGELEQISKTHPEEFNRIARYLGKLLVRDERAMASLRNTSRVRATLLIHFGELLGKGREIA